MVIWLDMYIIQNLIANYFLLNITCKIVNVKVRILRLIISTIIGTIYATAVLVFPHFYLNNLILKFLVPLCMCWLVIKTKKILKLLKFFAVFILLTVSLAGVCLLIYFSNGQGIVLQGNTLIQFAYDKLLLGIMLLYILLERVFIYVSDKKNIKNFIYDVKFCFKDNEIFFKALLDSGNGLREPATNLPVIIIEKNIFNTIHIEEKELYKIPYKVVNGNKDFLMGIKIDRVLIKKNKRDEFEKKAIIAFTDAILSDENEFNGLLSRGVID